MADRDLGKTAHEALGALLGFLQDGPTKGLAVADLVRLYRKVKQQQGRQAVAGRLGLDEDGLVRLDRVVRSLGRELTSSSRSAAGHQIRTIAVLRFFCVLQTMSPATQTACGNIEMPARFEADLARRELRALDLLLREIVREAFAGEALNDRLRAAFGAAMVAEWTRLAGEADALAAMPFADLATFVIDKPQFDRLAARYFAADQALTFLGDRRASAFALLDDIAHIRNALAGGRTLTTNEINLTGVYYDEIVEPLQQAFDRLATRINPERYLDADASETTAYFARLTVDPRPVRESVAGEPVQAPAAAPEPAAAALPAAEPATDRYRSFAGQRRLVDAARVALTILIGIVGIHTGFLLTRL